MRVQSVALHNSCFVDILRVAFLRWQDHWNDLSSKGIYKELRERADYF